MFWKRCLVLIVAAAPAGCGATLPAHPEAHPVRGEVRLSNGRPVRFGRVSYHPEPGSSGLEAHGEIRKDGSYTMTTFQKGDGVVPGRYAVSVHPYSYATGNFRIDRASPIPRRYGKAEASDLRVEVAARANVIPLRLRTR